MKSLLSWPKKESWPLCCVKGRLHEHAARAAARVEDDALVGSSIATSVRTMLAGVKYSPPRLPSDDGELADEVLVDPADQVVAAVLAAEDVLREQVDQPGDVLRVEVRAGVDARQQALELVGNVFSSSSRMLSRRTLMSSALGVLDDVRPSARPPGR